MENENEKVWEQLRQFYRDNFDTADFVDMATNFDILVMCARGASNKSIAEILELDVEIVSYIIDKHLGFTGWTKDLEFNPLSVYEGLDNSDTHPIETFVDRVAELLPSYEGYDLKSMYRVAEHVHYIERLLNENWI